jgi:hypothetical protein
MEVVEAAQYIKKIEQAIVELLEEFEQESGLVVKELIGRRIWAYIGSEEGLGSHLSVAITIRLPAA